MDQPRGILVHIMIFMFWFTVCENGIVVIKIHVVLVNIETCLGKVYQHLSINVLFTGMDKRFFPELK